MNKNEHIKKYLDYYCDRKNITPFAVLLKGKWGCGKTFFIKEYITDKKKFIHVSLYGIAEFTEIKERTIIEMLPLIPEKYNKIINSIYKSIKNIPKVKKWLPADSDELLIDLFLKKNAIVFIFDDLERCNIPIDKLLGYINHLVEFQNQKVILVGDEEKILESTEASTYEKIKEKLIGKELSVNSNPEKAIEIFTGNINNVSLKKFTKTIKKLLLKIFQQSQYENLRIIQQGISHFEYFFQSIPNEIQKNKELFEKMFYEFIVIFVEYKKGEIKSGDFGKKYPHFFKESSSDELEKKHFLDKYDNGISHWLACFDVKILGKILQGKNLIKNEQENLIQNLNELIGVEQESWQKLWNFKENSDKDFFKNLEDVQKKWKGKEYSDFYKILHVFGIFLYLSESDFIDSSKKTILKEGEEYINYLIKVKKFPLDLQKQNSGFGWHGSSYGFGYHSLETEEWKAFVKFITQKSDELQPNYVKNKIRDELMPMLKGEEKYDQISDLFINYNFLHTNGNRESYFQYLKVEEIAQIIIKRDIIFLSILQKTFQQRYTNKDLKIKNIDLEIPFLKNLKMELEKEVDKIRKEFGNRKTPKIFLVESFIKNAIEPFTDQNK